MPRISPGASEAFGSASTAARALTTPGERPSKSPLQNPTLPQSPPLFVGYRVNLTRERRGPEKTSPFRFLSSCPTTLKGHSQAPAFYAYRLPFCASLGSPGTFASRNLFVGRIPLGQGGYLGPRPASNRTDLTWDCLRAETWHSARHDPEPSANAGPDVSPRWPIPGDLHPPTAQRPAPMAPCEMWGFVLRRGSKRRAS